MVRINQAASWCQFAADEADSASSVFVPALAAKIMFLHDF